MKNLGKGLVILSIGFALGLVPFFGVISGWDGLTFVPLYYVVLVLMLNYYDWKETEKSRPSEDGATHIHK